MNRLPQEKKMILEAALRSGISTRKAEKLCNVHKNTAWSWQKRLGLNKPRPRSGPKRDRRAYLKIYNARQKMNHYRRLVRLDRIHGNIALWLAKNPKPQSLDKIFYALRVQFPDLKKQSLKYMLNKDSWGCYRKTSQGYTYKINPWYHPVLGFRQGKKTKYPEMQAAREIYLSTHGMRDKFVDEQIERMKRQNEDYVESVKRSAVRKSIPQLQLMATAVAISNQHEANR